MYFCSVATGHLYIAPEAAGVRVRGGIVCVISLENVDVMFFFFTSFMEGSFRLVYRRTSCHFSRCHSNVLIGMLGNCARLNLYFGGLYVIPVSINRASDRA